MHETINLLTPILSWFGVILYISVIVGVAIQVIYDTVSPSKSIGYLLLIIFVPLLGVILYLSIGVNYRNRSMYSKKVITNESTELAVGQYIRKLKEEALELENPSLRQFEKLARYIASHNNHWLSHYNEVTLLNNGEEKFPEVIEALENAKKTIHLEYYIIRNDEIGNKIKEILIKKAQEGVSVRLIYDDFGSRAIRRKFKQELQAAGVEVYPFRKLIFITLANRLNYRNHRKIIIVDGMVGFVGGINIGDDYINFTELKPYKNNPLLALTPKNQPYHRDVHIKVVGYSCYSLQYLFLSAWNFCANQYLSPSDEFFPRIDRTQFKDHHETTQIVSSGPDSPEPTIMNSTAMAISSARREILITTPYFVPSELILSTLKMAAMSGVSVKLLIPKRTNSFFVQWASQSLFEALMTCGVEIYLYEKGFIHAKTAVFDRRIGIVGTANMDNRSFDLNFEVNAIIYDEPFAEKMVADFTKDLEEAERLSLETWKKSRSKIRIFFEKAIYLTSSLL